VEEFQVPNPQRQAQRQAMHKLSRRYTLILSAVVGVLAGSMAVLFRVLVEATENLRSEAGLQLWHQYHWVGMLALILLGGGLGALAAWVTQRFCPEAGGSGIPAVKAILVTSRRLRPARLIPVKMGAGLLALGAGMSLGREGPTVHIGSACAEAFAKLLRLPSRTRRTLIAAGAGAGLAAAFNAPLAGFLFIMEELRRDLSRATYASALVTSMAAVGVTRFFLGYNPTFHGRDFEPLHLKSIPGVILIGLAGGLVGLLFNRSLMAATKKKGMRVARGMLAGALGGMLALTLPAATGGGNRLTQSLLLDDGTISTGLSFLAVLLITKFLFTVLCYSSGVPGGFFAPLLTMGAILGTLLSGPLHTLMPALTPDAERMATLGMAAVLAGSVRAPLTGVVLVVEMTGEYRTLFSLMLASFIAYALCEVLRCEPIYEDLLARDLKHAAPSGQTEARLLELSVETGSLLDGSRIDHLTLPQDSLVALVERENEVLVPHGKTRLQAGDRLQLVVGPHCSDAEIARLLEALRAPG
jgi:CIC family chloride channel protein